MTAYTTLRAKATARPPGSPAGFAPTRSHAFSVLQGPEAPRDAARSPGSAAALVHELSQPLSAIGSYARAMQYTLTGGLASPEQLGAIAERIVAESARTRETLQRIRDLFRREAVTREPVAVEALVAGILDALRDRLRARRIRIASEIAPGIAPVPEDGLLLRIVFHHVVGNALDAVTAAQPPRWIRIAARERAHSVEVEVIDSGPGIDPVVRNRLFEPFTTSKPAGMGLGLPLSRTLLQAHGGTLVLASVHPTTFRFTLPTHG